MGKALSGLYEPEFLTLADEKQTPDFEFDDGAMNDAMKWLHEQGGFTAKMLRDEPVQRLMDETNRILSTAVASSINQDVPPELIYALTNNTFIFSGFKTYHTLNEVGLQLFDDKGQIKPFEEFTKDVMSVHEKYNRNYLYAEYNHAIHASQMAVKWNDFSADKDRYNLQYRTAGDDKVRTDHAVLNGTTLPQSDPFWSLYLPPNGWNCRCNVVQVRKGKYPESDSEKAIEAGNFATESPKLKIFRFNPGESLKIFPDKHPYYKAPKNVETEILKQAAQRPVITTQKEVWDEIRRINDKAHIFERGFGELQVETNPRCNGSTDIQGNIWLKKERIALCVSGMDKLKRGLEIEVKEADALATLWHEITHNRNKFGMMHISDGQRWKMELANEFVARNSLPEFYEAMGAKMQHPEFMSNRGSTGYNRYVRNYCTIIEKSGADFNGVLKDVRKFLFNEKYDVQETGLVDALMKNGATKKDGSKFKKTEIKRMISLCMLIDESEYYERGIKSFIE